MSECVLQMLDKQIEKIEEQLRDQLERDPELLEILAALGAILDTDHGIWSKRCGLCGSSVDFNTLTGNTVHKRSRAFGLPCFHYSNKGELPPSNGRVC